MGNTLGSSLGALEQHRLLLEGGVMIWREE